MALVLNGLSGREMYQITREKPFTCYSIVTLTPVL